MIGNAWAEAGGEGKGYYTGTGKEPKGKLLDFIIELTKQVGHPMTTHAVFDVLRKEGEN